MDAALYITNAWKIRIKVNFVGIFIKKAKACRFKINTYTFGI